jgi:hypothetical protein
MAVFKNPLVFSKTDRIHRLIIGFLPAQEREENYLPFSERSAFSMRKQYDLVVDEIKDDIFMGIFHRLKVVKKPQNISLDNNSIFGRPCLVRDKDILSNDNNIRFIFKMEKDTIRNVLGMYYPWVYSKEYITKARHETIEFLRQNGFKLKGREKTKTLSKMLMSF